MLPGVLCFLESLCSTAPLEFSSPGDLPPWLLLELLRKAPVPPPLLQEGEALLLFPHPFWGRATVLWWPTGWPRLPRLAAPPLLKQLLYLPTSCWREKCSCQQLLSLL